MIDRRDGVDGLASLGLLIMPRGETIFVCDTQVAPDPSARELADMTLLAADQVRRFGITPKVALLSHSN